MNEDHNDTHRHDGAQAPARRVRPDASAAKATRPNTPGAKATRPGAIFWISLIALSGAASMLAVRLATPLAVDERWFAFLVFFVLPAIPIALLGLISRGLGVSVAALIPAVWLYFARAESDSLLIWLVPLAAAACLIALVPRRQNSRALLLTSLVVALLVSFVPGPGRPPTGPEVVLIGIDGATWDRIDPLVSEGRLPNFARLLENGQRAKLRSLRSMFSPQVWSSIATGCPPEVHGIDDFASRQSDFRVGRIWDEVKREGGSYGLSGWFFTWPPLSNLDENDFVIPSTFASGRETHPPEYSFLRQLWARERWGHEGISYVEAGLKAFRYGVRLSTLRHAAMDVLGRKFETREARDQYWRSRRLHVEFQADVFAELLRARRPDFAATLFKPVDTVSHMHWKYMDPEGFPDVTADEMDRYGGVIDKLYDEADRAVGKIIQAVPENADIVIVSDHGFQSARGSKIVDAYCRIRTMNLIDALGMSDQLSGTNLDDRVYLRAVGVTEAEGADLLDQVERSLSGLHLAGNPNPILELVREGRVMTLRIRRNIGLRTDLNIVMDDKQYPFDQLIRATESALYSGEHHPDGIYLLSGPSVSRAIETDSLHVLDVAPTVAALLDLPKSPLWPGRAAVRDEGQGERMVAEYAPPSVPSDPAEGVDKELKDKLRAIGYLE